MTLKIKKALPPFVLGCLVLFKRDIEYAPKQNENDPKLIAKKLISDFVNEYRRDNPNRASPTFNIHIRKGEN